jgi:hypothetical protein
MLDDFIVVGMFVALFFIMYTKTCLPNNIPPFILSSLNYETLNFSIHATMYLMISLGLHFTLSWFFNSHFIILIDLFAFIQTLPYFIIMVNKHELLREFFTHCEEFVIRNEFFEVREELSFIEDDKHFIECEICLENKHVFKRLKGCSCKLHICKKCVIGCLENYIYKCPWCYKKYDVQNYFTSKEYMKNIKLNVVDFTISPYENGYNFVDKITQETFFVKKENGEITSDCDISNLIYDDNAEKWLLTEVTGEEKEKFFIVKIRKEYFLGQNNIKYRILSCVHLTDSIIIEYHNWENVKTLIISHKE